MKLFRSVLHEALEKSGKVLKKNFGHVTIRYKGRANLVTKADLESQETILNIITKNLPGHDYRAEEAAVRTTGSDYTWIIDPLDGTTNYAHNYPAFCISIGLLHKSKPLLAGVYDPSRDELFTAEAKQGAHLNGKKIHVSKTKKLDESLLVTGFAYDRAERSKFYVEYFRRFMIQCHDVRRSGTAALDLAWIAAGRVDGFWEFKLAPWDVAAGRLLVEEAGGIVSDFNGKPWTGLETYGRQTLATNGRVHKEMLGVLKHHG
jgi:myo-inositol-1(or 4)-monophosphatase